MPADNLLLSSTSSIDAESFMERIKAEVHRVRTEHDDAILRAMCSALAFYAAHRFWFNESTFTFLTKSGQREYGKNAVSDEGYGYPDDLLRVDLLRIQIDDNNIYRLDRGNYLEIREQSTVIDSINTGYPAKWGFHHDKIILYPSPRDDDWTILGDYVRDVGTPICTFGGAQGRQWELRDKGGRLAGLNWTSDLLQNAEELIRHRTKADLYANVLLDPEKALAAKLQEQEVLNRMQSRTDWKLEPGPATPWY